MSTTYSQMVGKICITEKEKEGRKEEKRGREDIKANMGKQGESYKEIFYSLLRPSASLKSFQNKMVQNIICCAFKHRIYFLQL